MEPAGLLDESNTQRPRVIFVLSPVTSKRYLQVRIVRSEETGGCRLSRRIAWAPTLLSAITGAIGIRM